MSFDGTAVQNAIYMGGAEWPITPADWESRAEAGLEPEAFGYIAGGAGAELTMRANREAFERRRLRPRMLTGNLERDLLVDVLGTRSAAPFLLAPIGVLSIAHPAGVAMRATFLIDRSGVVQHQTVNNLPIGRNVDELLRVVDALQFTEQHGEVCPAGWIKGDKAMKPTADGVSKYLTERGSKL